jgi:nucleotide-binding universal stress UspA family protein
MHVVVAVNESEPSLFAFDWMIENIIKESKNHKLSILTVVEPPVQAGYYYAASGGNCFCYIIIFSLHCFLAIYSANFLEEIYKKATEDATACVKKFQKRLEEKLGGDSVACELVVGRGDTRDEIVDYVEASKADLLIMGSRDMNALKR